MTLPEMEEKQDLDLAEVSLDVGETIRQIMMTSFLENRLTCGAFDCASLLETDPDRVLICILPESTEQSVPVKIQHTLIEAYCRENKISTLKVESETCLSNFLPKTKDGNNGSSDSKTGIHNDNSFSKNSHAPLERKQSNTRDFTCFLVKRPDALSSAEKLIMSFCDNFRTHSDIIVEIPG